MWINVDVKRQGAVTSFSDKIGSISLEMDNEAVVIGEADKILELVKTVREVDLT